ncbi:hypothetical protein H4582DRAFT_117595 [Lactarius indigo]|nr:hypothetical protein H4582DRAFT_117595 [Lactarius indigo]
MASEQTSRSSSPSPSEIQSPSSDFTDLGASPSSGVSKSNFPPATPPVPAQPREPLSLTSFKGSGFAATEAIKCLLQAIGRDVVSFRRNTHVSYLVVERARDIVTAINEYISRVESSDAGDWDSFEKFSSAIEPLEDILFQLLVFTEDEKTRYFGNDRDIADCITSTEAWAENRKRLSETLKSFHTHTPLVNLFDREDSESRDRDRQDALDHDDRSLMKEIGSARKNIFDSKRYPKYVTNAVTPLDTLQKQMTSESLPEWLTVITIKTCMLVQGVLEVVLQPNTSTELLNHLKSKTVWGAVTALTKALVGVDKRLPALPKEVEDKYEEFLKILQKLSKLALKLPDSFVNILKEAGRVRRPFQAQAFALVMLCRFLADHFNKIGDKTSVTVDHVNSLEEAFNETLTVLHAAINAVTQLSVFNLTDFESNSTVQEFERVESVIKESFTSFGLSEEWSKKENVRKEAWEKDKSRMEQLNKVLNKPQSTSATVMKVNISIRENSPDGRELCNTTVSEEITTRLLALRWTVATALQSPDDAKRARTGGSFYKSTNNEIVELQNTIKEVSEANGEVNLKLVLA